MTPSEKQELLDAIKLIETPALSHREFAIAVMLVAFAGIILAVAAVMVI